MIDDFIAHLKANAPDFKTVDYANDLKPVDKIQDELPMLGIFPGDDSASPDATDFIESKMLTSVIQVHLICPIEDWQTLRATLRSVAIGWPAAPHYTGLAIVSGHVLELKGGVIWWEELYANRHIIREIY